MGDESKCLQVSSRCQPLCSHQLQRGFLRVLYVLVEHAFQTLPELILWISALKKSVLNQAKVRHFKDVKSTNWTYLLHDCQEPLSYIHFLENFRPQQAKHSLPSYVTIYYDLVFRLPPLALVANMIHLDANESFYQFWEVCIHNEMQMWLYLISLKALMKILGPRKFSTTSSNLGSPISFTQNGSSLRYQCSNSSGSTSGC